MGEGNVFTGVCHLFTEGGSALGRTRGLPFDGGLAWGIGVCMEEGLHVGTNPPELWSSSGRYSSYWNPYLFTFACCA